VTRKLPYILVAIFILSCTSLFGADSNTVSSTVVTDKSVPTASAPSIVICRDHRVFDAMWMSGTPCPFMGKIGDDAKTSWEKNLEVMPDASEIRSREETKIVAAIIPKPTTKVTKPIKRPSNETKKSVWVKPIGAILMLLLL